MDTDKMAAEQLAFAYGGAPVLTGVSFTLKPGAVTALLGANACGKTTLLKLLTKNLRPDAGRVLLGGRDIAGIRRKAFARRVAVVHQKNTAPDDLPVKQLVSYGRIPHGAMLRGRTKADRERVVWALEATGITDIADRPVGTLSGGQRQRAFIALALAQDTALLFLDEPTAFLDVRYQVETLRLIRELNAACGLTVLMALHDINQALLYADEVIGLKEGRIAWQGPPAETVTAASIQSLYGIRLEVHAEAGRRWVLPV